MEDTKLVLPNRKGVGQYRDPARPEGGRKMRDFQVSNFDITPISFTIGNGVDVVSTGVWDRVYVPFGFTIYQWTMGANAAGSIVVDLWMDAHANYPPTVADTITASAKPTLSTATSNQSNALTGWTTICKAGQWIFANVDSASTLKKVTLVLSGKKGL